MLRLHLSGTHLKTRRTQPSPPGGAGEKPLRQIKKGCGSSPSAPSESSRGRRLNCGQQQPLCGLHVGIGPPSGAGSIGAATAQHVHAKPTTKANSLIARFIVLSPCVQIPLGAETCAPPNYRDSRSGLSLGEAFGVVKRARQEVKVTKVQLPKYLFSIWI